MKRVLILCTGNSCRSQMAEALWQAAGQGGWEAVSAGSHPTGYVHPLAVRAIAELDLDIADSKSKHVDLFEDESFDLVVTVCDSARESCPVLAGAVHTAHWPFHDPAHAEGTEAERLTVFRRVRDQIRARIEEYLGGAAS